MRKERARNITGAAQSKRLHACRGERPCEQAFTPANRRQRRRTRAFFSFRPVLPLLCTGYPNTKRRFLRGSEPRCARSPVRFPPANSPLALHRPSSVFIGVVPSLSCSKLFLRALVVPSRFLTLLSRVFFSPMRPCARSYTGCLWTGMNSLMLHELIALDCGIFGPAERFWENFVTFDHRPFLIKSLYRGVFEFMENLKVKKCTECI